MSADNEIAILEIKKEKKYYVAVILGCPSVDEVVHDEKWHKKIKKIARSEKRVFNTYGDASDNARTYMDEMIEEEGCPVEYGITFYSVPNDKNKKKSVKKGRNGK